MKVGCGRRHREKATASEEKLTFVHIHSWLSPPSASLIIAFSLSLRIRISFPSSPYKSQYYRHSCQTYIRRWMDVPSERSLLKTLLTTSDTTTTTRHLFARIAVSANPSVRPKRETVAHVPTSPISPPRRLYPLAHYGFDVAAAAAFSASFCP